MRAYDIIAHKRDGTANSRAELEFLLQGYLRGSIGEEQMAAWLMAVYFQGMNEEETLILTDLMEHSGDRIDFRAIDGVVVDKHSTGGVGDKTTLVVAPLAAAAGVPIGKLSGRGLGFTGGTIDKLEAIPGYQTSIPPQQFLQQIQQIGIALAGQTANLVPADKKIYALRDLTATVESIPLIASSIMSKKLASGAGKIVLDVKFGSGAFMQQPERAEQLARTMVNIGNGLGRQTVAVLTSMEEPLGYAVGNTLEVQEAMDTLQGHGPADLLALCIALAGQMIYLGGKAAAPEAGCALAQQLLDNGRGWQKFAQLVAAQGGDLQQGLPQASYALAVPAMQTGIVQTIDAKAVGRCSMLLGAGRESKTSVIDLSAGVLLHKKTGSAVKAGEPLATLYYNDAYAQRAQEALVELQQAYTIGANAVAQPPLILKTID